MSSIFKEGIFQGKRILVTGGGSGIGKSIAQRYLELGAHVMIASRNEEKLQSAQKDLSSFGDCHYGVCDIRKEEDIESLSKHITDKMGGLDILVNNAGGQFPSLAEDLSKNGWNAVINNNLNGTWYMTQAMGKSFFIPAKSGCILNIIVNIYRGFPGMVHTGAARAGVDNMTKTLSIEWSKYNININAIAPGLIFSTGFQQYPEEIRAGIAKKIPMKRLGTTDEVADLATYLTSSAAAYITGETVYIDGGSRLHGDLYEL